MHCESQLHKIGTKAQYMPQTSNSLFSPTNGPLKFFEYQPPKIGIIPQNMSQNFKFPIIIH